MLFLCKQKTSYERRISDWSSACALPICLALLLSATAASAHGDEKHEDEATRPAVTAAVPAQPGADVEAMGSAAVSNETTQSHEDEQVDSNGIVGALKSLHPATVHFPIALLLMAALTELFVMMRRTPEREAAVKIDRKSTSELQSLMRLSYAVFC